MPRAAMSVATRTRDSPRLEGGEGLRALRLADRLPWMRSAATPRRARPSASRLARCLVRVKTSTFRTPGWRSSSTSSGSFSSEATG